MERIFINPSCPDPSLLAQAAAVIRAGGLVAFPTDTLYALAADPFNQVAVGAVSDAKGRASGRAMPLVAADAAQITSQIGPLPELARRLANGFWPGPLTILMNAPHALAPEVTGGTGRIGVRIPEHAVARAFCLACASVLVATSANPSGRPASTNPDDVEASMGSKIDILIDSGRTPGGPPSTIVDATGVEVRLVRAGAISWERIETCLHE